MVKRTNDFTIAVKNQEVSPRRVKRKPIEQNEQPSKPKIDWDERNKKCAEMEEYLLKNGCAKAITFDYDRLVQEMKKRGKKNYA